MINNFLIFLVFLGILAAILQDDFIFTILYIFTGIYIVSRWWSNKSIKSVTITRTCSSRAFTGESVQIKYEMKNNSLLPVVWMRIQDSIPVELMTKSVKQHVMSLGPKENYCFDYYLNARRRGFYKIGPIIASTGDLFGVSGIKRITVAVDQLIIYPRIIHLTNLKLPSFSPLGNLPYQQPIYEDPVRIFGKREYTHGDTLRRIDWKSTASSGKLQVKLFEPSVTLETMIFLNLNREDYEYKRWRDLIELAIIIAASISYWVSSKRQPIGLVTNGVYPISDSKIALSLPPRKGRGHLMQILDVLACVESTVNNSLIELLQNKSVELSWGSTVAIITGQMEEAMFGELFQIRRAGVNVVLIIVGETGNWSEIKSRADYFGFPIHHIRNEFDLDTWRN